jgi:hypothetical protein
MLQTTAELIPQILLQLQQGPMTRTPLMTALGCRQQPGNFTRALTCLVGDQRIERTGRGSYSVGPKGSEPFTVEDGVGLSAEYSARSKRPKVLWPRREAPRSRPLRSSRP